MKQLGKILSISWAICVLLGGGVNYGILNAAEGSENFIANGSFETWTGAFNSYTYLYKNTPGTSDAITGWRYTPDTGYTAENFTGITTDYGFGVAPTTNPFGEGRNIPDGDYALFIQRPGTVSTTISGLTVGESYVLTYFYDSRDNNDTFITTSLGDWTLQSSEKVARSRDFYKNTVRFIATEESLSLSFANADYREVQDTNTGNWRLSDSTVLVDAVSLEAQTANAYSGWVRNLDLWKGDSSSTISSEQTYSHTLNFGPNDSITDAVLNGVSFKAYGGTNPTSDASGVNFSVTGDRVNPDSGLQNNLEGTGSDALSKGFIYGLSQIQLNGLIPGMSYETTFFGAYWDNNVSRRIGRFTAPDGSRIEVDEQTFIENGTRYGGTFSWRGEASETGNLQFNVQNFSGDTFHLYALANAASPDKDVVMATGFGGLNGENNRKQIVGTTMDYANIEGNNTWQVRGGYLGHNSRETLCIVEDGVLKTGANCGSAMEFASEDYAGKKISMQIDLKMGTLEGDQWNLARGMGLGFFDAEFGTTGEVGRGFSGLVLNPDGGLMFYDNQGTAKYSERIDFGGDFSVEDWYTLAMTVEMSPDGELATLLDVSLSGSRADYSSLIGNVFNTTDLLGILSSSANSWNYFGYADNLIVRQSVPEPGTWLLLALGIGVLGIMRKKKKILPQLLAGLVCLGVFSAESYAELVGQWRLDGNATMKDGDSTMTAWETLTDGTTWNNNTVGADVTYTHESLFGRDVFSFAGDSIINVGKFPTISPTAGDDVISDYTYSFWVQVDPTNPSTSILVGNRRPSGTLNNGDEGYNFIKVMSTGLGYGANNSTKIELFNTESPLPTDGTWVQCTVTKVGNRITYYQNGVSVGSITTADTMQANDFSFGGDWDSKAERATGKLSDVRVYDTGMSAAQVGNLYNIYRESYFDGIAARMSSDTLKLYDNFHSGIDSNRWSVVNRGLESSGVGTFSASVNADGQLVLEGVMDSRDQSTKAWGGVCLQTNETYSATAGEEEIVIHVKRFSLEEVNPDSTGVRSGIYLRDSSGKYFLFAQNTESGTSESSRWSYNTLDIKYGGESTRYTDCGYHDVALKYDGSQVFMYLDGQMVGSTAMTLGDFTVSLMASARATTGDYSTVNDAVKAVFDTPMITYRNIANIPVSPAQIQDTFSGNTLSKAWKSTGTATVGNGVLRLTNASAATFQMPYYSNEDFTISVNRDSMRITPGATSGLKLVSEDGAWLSVFQSGTTGEWFLEWDGMNLAFGGAASLNSGSESLLTTDWMTHQILLDSVFDSENGVAEMTLSLDNAEFSFQISDWLKMFQVQLFSTGTNASAGFAQFALTGTQVPEPATWISLLLGLGIWFGFRWRKFSS